MKNDKEEDICLMQNLYLVLNSGGFSFSPYSFADQVIGGVKDYMNICSEMWYYLGLKPMNCETLIKMKTDDKYCKSLLLHPF